ncbi:AbrB/MazE/SpoVT family DNA-binding domain-containing protein [Novosphingobium sp.]|uniref:AbrB/MazE/SpoVT family DNA-binding domain-containing protein n=1 Tax=Novosphingobium sp. TaxID=1874826 RepID=UPI002B484483|nr:AbrB/MazE/SpoVT family DNA-binding domain-containing protein [Novosphingobium sp.]HKR90742.1 AbrB/MazE/SpoVT family DNA-binding domain-containing protein [Novosphingobium sp.]
MQTSLRKMGNSTGMILPKAVLDELGLKSGAKVELRVVDGEVVVRPARRKIREGWEEAAKIIGPHGLTDEEREWLNMPSEFDEEWEW